MLIENAVTIPASPQEVFDLINDVERVASCLPGAELVGPEGENAYRGRVKVRVGPISAQFEGVMTFVEVDSENRTMHMVGRGSDKKGNGDAEADVRLSVVEHAEGAQLKVDTDLNIKGKFVQFGKGAISAVSSKILAQFAQNMADLLAGKSETVAAAEGGSADQKPGVRKAVGEGSAAVTAPGSGAAIQMPGGIGGGTGAGILVAVFVAGCVEGWILTLAFGRR